MKSIFHALNRLKVFRGLTEQEFAWVYFLVVLEVLLEVQLVL